MLVQMVQHVFSTSEFPTELTWTTLVLLPKEDGSSRGIGLMDVIWKLITSIIDARLKGNIDFHDSLHGFRTGRGTGTTIIEAILFQQTASINQTPIFQVFLDLRKAYDTVDRDRLLDVLKADGVGENLCRVLKTFWQQQQTIAKQSGYYGNPFQATRGFVQRDPLSPTLFNILVDAVVRYWLSLPVEDGGLATQGPVDVVKLACLVLFYVDDALITSTDSKWLQRATEKLSELFERMGLKTNTSKTKAMTCFPGYISNKLSTQVYKRRQETIDVGTTAGQTVANKRSQCTVCGKDLALASIAKHMRSLHGIATTHANANVMSTSTVEQPQTYRMHFYPEQQ